MRRMRKTMLVIGCVMFLHTLDAAASDWFVRPKTGEYGGEDGTSYATAWDGLADITWGAGGVTAGDTLYICGTFDCDGEGQSAMLSIGASGTSGNVITIRGDYSGDPGVLISAYKISSWTDNGDGSFYVSRRALSASAWENAPGSGDVVIQPVTSQSAVASTDGSHWRNRFRLTSFADIGGGEVQVNCTTDHQLSNGDNCRIYGTTNYNDTYSITSVDANSFKITETWNGDDATGWGTDDIFWYNPTGEATATVYTTWNVCVNGNGYDYITITNLSLYGGGSGVIKFELPDDPQISQHFTVDSCHIKYCTYDGIKNGQGGDNYTITNNTIEEFTGGIYISSYAGTSPDNVTITNNVLDCGTAGYNSYWAPGRENQDRSAIALQPGDDYTITDNHIVRAVDCGIIFFLHTGPVHSMTNMHILRNRIDIVHDPADDYDSSGISFAGGNGEGVGDATTGMIIAQNIIKDCYYSVYNKSRGKGISLKCGDHTDSATRPLVSGNIVTGCDTNYALDRANVSGEMNCEYIFNNNISYNPRTNHVRVYIAPDGYDLDMDYNIWYPDTVGGVNNFYWANDPVADDFADFISDAAADGLTIGGNSFVADPLFVDFNNSDFHLQSDSPAIDAGVDVGLIQDFEGNQIPQGDAPDIGAYEYDPGITTNHPGINPDTTSLHVFNNIITKSGNTSAMILCNLKEADNLYLTIYDAKGKEIITLFDGHKTAGLHTAIWSGADAGANMVGSGIYLVHLKAGGYTETKKIAVIK